VTVTADEEQVLLEYCADTVVLVVVSDWSLHLMHKVILS